MFPLFFLGMFPSNIQMYHTKRNLNNNNCNPGTLHKLFVDDLYDSPLKKKWDKNSCIYLIYYKHNPLIYYIKKLHN